ncbi:MAG: ABC transporter substrate-binding protein [Solirubrobacteraceae bacterium]
MSSFGKRVYLGALAAAAIVLVAACGSSGSGGSSSSSSAAPAAAATTGASSGTSTSTSAASASSSKTYVLATSADFPPFSSRAADDPNTIIGFEPDMMKAVMGHLGWKYKWVTSDFDCLIPAVQSGRVDIVVSDVYDTSAREKVVDFVDYLKTGLSVMVTSANASKVHSFMDVCGHPMGILTGASTELEFGQKASNACKKAGKPAIDIHSYPAVAQEVPALANGTLYAMFEDTITEQLIANKRPGTLKVVFDDPEASTPLGMAVKKGGSIESQLRSGVQWYLGTAQYKADAKKQGFPTSSLISKP